MNFSIQNYYYNGKLHNGSIFDTKYSFSKEEGVWTFSKEVNFLANTKVNKRSNLNYYFSTELDENEENILINFLQRVKNVKAKEDVSIVVSTTFSPKKYDYALIKVDSNSYAVLNNEVQEIIDIFNKKNVVKFEICC